QGGAQRTGVSSKLQFGPEFQFLDLAHLRTLPVCRRAFMGAEERVRRDQRERRRFCDQQTRVRPVWRGCVELHRSLGVARLRLLLQQPKSRRQPSPSLGLYRWFWLGKPLLPVTGICQSWSDRVRCDQGELSELWLPPEQGDGRQRWPTFQTRDDTSSIL